MSKAIKSTKRATPVSLLLTAALALAALPAFAGCNNDGQVLATFDGGDIKRGELREIFELDRLRRMRYGMNRPQKLTVQDQNRALRDAAVLKMAAKEALTSGLNKQPEYKKAVALLPEQLLVEAFEFNLLESKDQPKYKMLELQFLGLRNPNAKPQKPGGKVVNPKPSPRDNEAEDLLKQLNDSSKSDKEIEELIARKTEYRVYKVNGGYLSPTCTECRLNGFPFLTKPLAKTPMKKFVHIKDPRQQGHWLVRKVGEKTVSLDDLKDHFEDFFRKQARIVNARVSKNAALKRGNPFPLDEKSIELRAKQFSDRYQSTARSSRFPARIDELKKKKKFVLHEPARRKPGKEPKDKDFQDSTPMFTMNGKLTTYGDIKKKLPDPHFNAKERLQRLNLIVFHELLKEDPEFKKTPSTSLYKVLKTTRTNISLGSLYFRKSQPPVKVSNQQIKERYIVGKNNVYKGKSLSQVRAQIRRQLEQQNRRQAARRLQETLIKKYKLKILSAALKEGKI